MMDGLPDRIYEAALVPELWPDVLDAIGDLSGSAGGALLVMSQTAPPRWAASASVAPRLDSFVNSGAWRASQRATLWRGLNFAGFARDIDLLTREEANALDPTYRTHGLGWQVGTVIGMPSGETVIVTGERHAQDGCHAAEVLPRLDALRPDLARASLLGARLGLERAQAAAATLGLIGLPAAVLSATGRVLGINDRLEALSDVVLPRAHGGLALTDATANALVRDAVRTAACGLDGPARSIPVRAGPERSAFIAHVIPVRGLAQDIFNEAAALLVVTAVRVPHAPSNALLHGLFDLTPAETRLLRALAGGARLRCYADGAGVSVSTVRTQLASIFHKTGTSRQSDLISIVTSVATLGGEGAAA